MKKTLLKIFGLILFRLALKFTLKIELFEQVGHRESDDEKSKVNYIKEQTNISHQPSEQSLNESRISISLLFVETLERKLFTQLPLTYRRLVFSML